MQYVDALNVLREAASMSPARASEEIALAEACGRVCAEDVVSEIVLPPFTNSAVDGFAVPHGATTSAPVRFRIAGTLFPGETPSISTPAGHAWAIMTGAPVPLDCDACAKVEDTIVETEEGFVENARSVPLKTWSVEIRTPLAANENLRFKGTDYDLGTRVVSVGELIRPEHMMALASVGRARVRVAARPRVLLLSTGKELAEPGAALKPGEIFNSTRIFLQTALEALGCDVEVGPTMADEPQVFTSFMKQAMQRPPDLVVTTGAVSMGSADFIRPALEELGAKVLFHRVNIRPGKPILFGRLGSTAFFGLPGNPVSGVVGLRFFIEPFLRALSGRPSERAFRARLATAMTKPRDLRCFFKAQLVIDEGTASIHLMKGQPSYMVRPLLQSSVWAVLNEGEDSFKAGDLVDVFQQEATSYDFSAVQGEFT